MAFIKRILHVALRYIGLELNKLDNSMRTDTVLKQMLAHVPNIRTVIDVGASDGRWSLGAMKLIPASAYLMIEAAHFHFDALNRLKNSNPKIQVFPVAASNREQKVFFYHDENNPLGGGASGDSTSKHKFEVQGNSIDNIMAAAMSGPPYLLKIDAQGHEVEILEGAKKTLEQTELIFIEMYTIGEAGRLTFDEITRILDKLNFKPAGITGVLKRPTDNIWWQADFIFLKSSNPVFKQRGYDK